jgi:hypothetical protein
MGAGSNGTPPPERLTLWFSGDQRVGLDVRWHGDSGLRRAPATRDSLRSAGHPAKLVRDELGWWVRLDPIDRASMGEIIERFLQAG